ncbi:MAG: EAL domain-containing protein [Tumebacillaceae bacterium]
MDIWIPDVLQTNIDYLLFVLLVCGVCAVLELLKYRQVKLAGYREANAHGLRFSQGKGPVVALSLIVLMLVGGWSVVNDAGRQEEDRSRQIVEGIAPTFAYELRKMGHEQIRIATGMNDVAYLEILNAVKQWRAVNPDIQRIYTLRKLPDGQSVYVIAPDSTHDGYAKHAAAYMPIGHFYPRQNSELEQAFRGTQSFTEEPYKEGNIKIKTAYVPILDAQGGLDSVLGIDFNASRWEDYVQYTRLNVIAVITLLLIPVYTIYWVIYRTRVERFQFQLHQAELEESEDRFRKLSSASFEGIIILQIPWVLEVNHAFAEMFGYSTEEVMEMDVFSLIDQESRNFVKSNMLSNNDSSYEVIGLHKNGTRIVVEMVGTTCYYKGTIARVFAVRDITERKRAEELINHMAYHDSLTSLPNRLLFNERLTSALNQARGTGQRLAIMFLDLDRFKLVNDTLGHGMGDKLLIGVATRIIDCLESDDIVARMGGDEFTVLMHIDDPEEAARASEMIIAALKEPFVIDGYELHTTTSIGISLYPEDGDDAQVLMRNSDTAMYRAKDQGRNSYSFYDTAMNRLGIERLELENGLRYALEREELVVYYQPRLNLASGQIVGMEALVRWQHPVLGLVPPGRFIPLAEETGLIVPISEWVLETACKQTKKWLDSGYPPLQVAVNLSARQFQSPGLVERIESTLQGCGLAPEMLELEITESITMQDVDFTILTLRKLSDMGIHIAVDDFGTGYSSLSYLKNFPIHTLKIDQSFVRELHKDSYNAAIVNTVIYLARNLNLKVIAEGVETEQQLAFLRDQRCDEMQGFLFSRPVPQDEFERLLQENVESAFLPLV